MSGGTILLCAGGTGGHLFPAEALAHALTKRGYTIHLAVDQRANRFTGSFPAEEIHEIVSATVSSKNPVKIFKALGQLFRGYRQSQALLARLKPVAVVGFGGYPTVPPVFAASRIGIATAVHEANAVLGRANRLLATRVRLVATGFEGDRLGGVKEHVVTGNPVRPAIVEAAQRPYPKRKVSSTFKLLVFGGSQGAQFFGEILPPAIKLLDAAHRKRVRLVQQARADDQGQVEAAYADLGLKAEVATFFNDMADRIAAAHLVVSRAGASTVSELSVIGRPAILVPYPYALDHDQAENAAAMARAGGAEVISQRDLTPQVLAERLKLAMDQPIRLEKAAKAARDTGRPEAAETLADCVERMIAGGN